MQTLGGKLIRKLERYPCAKWNCKKKENDVEDGDHENPSISNEPSREQIFKTVHHCLHGQYL